MSRFVAFLVLLVLPALVLAQGMMRPVPEGAYWGVMKPPVVGELMVDGRSFPLSPGATIRNRQNMIVMPATIEETAPVMFTFNPQGQINRVWMLTPDELERAKAQR